MRVIVAGGGSAGLAAAVASARLGARTLLIERHGALGGMATAAFVHTICGLYLLREEPGTLFAHAGFPREFAERLLASGGAAPPVRVGRVDLLPTIPFGFATVADEVIAREPLLEVRLHTELTGVRTDGGAIRAVETLCRGEREWREADAFVDTTGDALLAMAAGVPCETAPILQRPAWIFTLGGVGATLDGDERIRLGRQMAAAVRSGALSRGVLGAHFRPTWRAGEVFVTLDLDDPPGGPVYNPVSPAALTAFEGYGRALAGELTAFLVRERPGFERAYVAAWPARLGVRESRRVQGRFRLEAEHLLEGARFPDAVARSTWPVELRETATGPRLRFPRENRPCDIPLGALRACGVENLWVAGRCLSSSHEAQAALRVIATAMATGEAAGLAAALQARAGGGEPGASNVVDAREQKMGPCSLTS